MDVTEFGDEHAGEDPPNSMDGLDGFVAGMATQRLVGVAFEGVDLAVVDLEQFAQGSDPLVIRRSEVQLVEESGCPARRRGRSSGRSRPPWRGSRALGSADLV